MPPPPAARKPASMFLPARSGRAASLASASRAGFAWIVAAPGPPCSTRGGDRAPRRRAPRPPPGGRDAYAEGLLDEAPSVASTGPLGRRRLAALERHDVLSVDGEFERLLHRDDALLRRARGDERTEEKSSCPRAWRRRRGCSGRSPSRCAQHVGDVRRHGSRGHQRTDVAVPRQVLAHVDRPVAAGDVRDHDVQPAAIRERRVDERLAEVRAPAGAGSIRSTRSRTAVSVRTRGCARPRRRGPRRCGQAPLIHSSSTVRSSRYACSGP